MVPALKCKNILLGMEVSFIILFNFNEKTCTLYIFNPIKEIYASIHLRKKLIILTPKFKV